MELGGPVWHVSVAAPGIALLHELKCNAYQQLRGVGNPALGEWQEWTGRAFHLRRRLSEREADQVGPVVDVRRTPEAQRRAQRIGDRIKWAPLDALVEELGPAEGMS